MAERLGSNSGWTSLDSWCNSEASRACNPHVSGCDGAGGEDRTPDLRFTKPLHYRCATPAQAVISAASVGLQAIPERRRTRCWRLTRSGQETLTAATYL